MNSLVSRVTFSEDLLDSVSMGLGTWWKDDVGVLHWTSKNGSYKGQRNRQTSNWEHFGSRANLFERLEEVHLDGPPFMSCGGTTKYTHFFSVGADFEAPIKNKIW